jgi:hypothetical protein
MIFAPVLLTTAPGFAFPASGKVAGMATKSPAKAAYTATPRSERGISEEEERLWTGKPECLVGGAGIEPATLSV